MRYMISTSVLIANSPGSLRPRNLSAVAPCKIATIDLHFLTCDASCMVGVAKPFVFMPFNCSPMRESSCANVSNHEDINHEMFFMRCGKNHEVDSIPQVR